MKRLSLKSKILLGAFVFGGFGAGATEIARTVANANQQQYTWQLYDKSTQLPVGGTFVDSENNVRDTYGCHDETELVCAVGTAPGVPSITIRYNE